MSIQPPQQAGQGPQPERITLRTLAKMARAAEPFACLACYDATTAKLCERAGVHLLLAGDSAAQVVLGFERTLDMPLDFAIHITAALRRGAPSRCIMADMPFLSYHTSEAEALKNAGRFLTEGMADIVKLEADATFAPLVRAMTRAGIPVCAHVGLLPQAAAISGYAARGRTAADARRIVDDAIALQDAGAAMLLVEAVPDETTEAILASTTVPLIGIGAGPACHAQILVINDLLGMQDWKPRFVEPAANLAPEITKAAAEWVRRVAAKTPGGDRYRMHQGEPERLETPNKPKVTWEGVKPSPG